MIISFGRYIHRNTDDPRVPDSYLMWLTDPEAANQIKGKPWDKAFKVPRSLQIAAREALTKRGYRKVGLRWEK